MDKLIKEQSLFTTSASLSESVDKRVLVILRDGRKLIGYLRTYDQYANLVLQNTVERVYAGEGYGDVELGIYVVRGENVVLMGEIDGEIEDSLELYELPVEQVREMEIEEKENLRKLEKKRKEVLFQQGFSVDFVDTDFY
ncbi:RNA cap binding protein [Neoconidiobolus thromboides FSU 785]|nr:RNA cap binding protein [Neoconidiobolus thromboides FSU 785]